MTNLSAPSRRELAHRSSDDIGVMLVRVADGRDGEERDVACVAGVSVLRRQTTSLSPSPNQRSK